MTEIAIKRIFMRIACWRRKVNSGGIFYFQIQSRCYRVQSTFDCQLCLSSQPLKNAAILSQGGGKPFIFKSFSKLMIQKVSFQTFSCDARTRISSEYETEDATLTSFSCSRDDILKMLLCFFPKSVFKKRYTLHKKVFTLKENIAELGK